jgi:hypothetical protein
MKEQGYTEQVRSIISDLQEPSSCTTRSGHTKATVYKLRVILCQQMKKLGWDYSTKMQPGGILLIRRF